MTYWGDGLDDDRGYFSDYDNDALQSYKEWEISAELNSLNSDPDWKGFRREVQGGAIPWGIFIKKDLFTFRCPRCKRPNFPVNSPIAEDEYFEEIEEPRTGQPRESDEHFYRDWLGMRCSCGHEYGVDPLRIYWRCPTIGLGFFERYWTPSEMGVQWQCECGEVHSFSKVLSEKMWELAPMPLLIEKLKKAGRLSIEQLDPQHYLQFPSHDGLDGFIYIQRRLQYSGGKFVEIYLRDRHPRLLHWWH